MSSNGYYMTTLAQKGEGENAIYQPLATLGGLEGDTPSLLHFLQYNYSIADMTNFDYRFFHLLSNSKKGDNNVKKALEM